MSKVALIVGTTGLIGSQLLELLLAEDHYTKLIAVSRKPLALIHPKLENLIVDFNLLSEYAISLKADDVFCCLGTTMKQAGSEAAFRKVDFEYPLEIARITHAAGASQFLLITALGANKKSSIFYNKVKGEIELAIGDVAFKTYHIFRPSFLQGDRAEKRMVEQSTNVFFNIFGFLVPKKYKAIDSTKVARAMLAKAKEGKQGAFIHESDALQGL